MKNLVKIEFNHEELQILEGAIEDLISRVKRHHPELRTAEEDERMTVYEKLLQAHTELFKVEEDYNKQ